jgi:hypothetical protein
VPQISVQLANSQNDFEEALILMHGGRNQMGYASPSEQEEGLWLTKHHALPSTNIIVAKIKGEVIGALTLFGESAFHLPMEEQADLSLFRQNLEGRVAEFSLPGLKPEWRENKDLLLALYHFALCFGTAYCHYDAFITQVPEDWGMRFRETLRYEPLLLKEKIPGLTFFRSAREGADFRAGFSDGFQPEFHFPERKFFLVAYQSLEPEVLRYLFAERTQLFERLTDLEIRVLKNYYDEGAYAEVLPNRALVLPFKEVPAHRRFPMNCDGHVCEDNGRRISIQVLDVSRDGLKIRTSEPLMPGKSYPVTIQIGVRKQSELIAASVWVDSDAHIAGVQVKSADQNWQAMIEYLERYFLRVAA